MTSFSGAFSTPRSHYIRIVLMGLECVEQGGCGLPGQATTVQSSHSATRAPPCTLVGGVSSWGYHLGSHGAYCCAKKERQHSKTAYKKTCGNTF